MDQSIMPCNHIVPIYAMMSDSPHKVSCRMELSYSITSLTGINWQLAEHIMQGQLLCLLLSWGLMQSLGRLCCPTRLRMSWRLAGLIRTS